MDADIRAAALEARKKPAVKKETSPNSTFEDLTPDYLEWVRLNKRPQTYREREYTMKYINKIVGNIAVTAFNDHHVSFYQKARNAQGVSNKTINKELYYVMAFLGYCRDEKELPVRDVKMKKLAYHRPLPVVLSPSEVARFLDAATPFYRAFFLCLYTLGLRFSEASNIKWDDIDMSNMAVRCEQKGGSFKILPMSKRLKDALKVIGPPAMGKYVFVSKRSGKPIVNVRKAIKNICLRAGIDDKKVYPHLFRHSSATNMMEGGIGLRAIQQMMGHGDSKTTEWYTHVAMTHLRGAENILEEGLKRGSSRRKTA